MKANQIKVDKYYFAKVSNKEVIVKVVMLPTVGTSYRNTYVCLNVKTGRTVYMKTAGRFRRPATEEEVQNIGK